MLLNVKEEDLPKEDKLMSRISLTFALIAPVVFIISAAIGNFKDTGFPQVSQDFGTIKSIGLFLFTKFTLPFEIVSILLLIALVGGVVLAKRKI